MIKNNNKLWMRVSLHCPPDMAEIIQSLFFEMGATGTQEQAGAVIGYFQDDRSASLLRDDFCRRSDQWHIPGVFIRNAEFEEVSDQNWGETWNRFFKPIRISDRLVVKPPWLDWTGPEPIVIDIMPKMAFGTGTHETTQLCLEMMGPLITPGCTVLDVGTGSGILSVAAIRLGAASCTSVDVDEDAIENAVENAENNGVIGYIHFYTGSVNLVSDSSFNLIMANIQSGILIPLIPEINNKMLDQSTVVFSGILINEGIAFQSHIESNGLSVIQIREKGEWMALQCQRTESVL